MKFNPEVSKQAKEVVFSCKYNKTRGMHPPLVFNDIPASTKHLGMILDENLNYANISKRRLRKLRRALHS